MGIIHDEAERTRRLAMKGYVRWVRFVAFFLHNLLHSRAERLFVCILRQSAVTANDFLTGLNPDQPLVLVPVP
jgi:hypothetical protein